MRYSLLKRASVPIYAYVIIGVLFGFMYLRWSLPMNAYLTVWGLTLSGPFAVLAPIGPAISFGEKATSLCVWVIICSIFIAPRLIWPSRLTGCLAVVGVLLWDFIGLGIIGWWV